MLNNIKSVFIRKRNNNYNVYVEYIDEETGKIKQKSQGKYTNKKDAEKHLVDLKSSIYSSKFIIPKDITLVDRCYKYINDNSQEWSYNTIVTSTSTIVTSIKPFFKDTLLNEVSIYQVQSFVNNLYRNFSATTAKNKYGLLRTILRECYRLKEINENITDFIKIPKKDTTSNSDVYTKEEVKLLIEKLNGESIEIPILLMVLLGLRKAEALGLKWKDVDFENNIININQVLIYKGKEGFSFKEPKSFKSKRSLHAPNELMKKLKNEKLRQNKLKLEGVLENEYDLVCLNSNLTPYIDRVLNVNFSKFVKRNNLRKIRLHDLRHTNATIMLLSGTNMKVVSERLGHSNIEISMNRYSHILEEMDKEASKNLSDLLFK